MIHVLHKRRPDASPRFFSLFSYFWRKEICVSAKNLGVFIVFFQILCVFLPTFEKKSRCRIAISARLGRVYVAVSFDAAIATAAVEFHQQNVEWNNNVSPASNRAKENGVVSFEKRRATT